MSIVVSRLIMVWFSELIVLGWLSVMNLILFLMFVRILCDLVVMGFVFFEEFD